MESLLLCRMQGLLHGCSPAVKMFTLHHPLQKILPFAAIEVAVVSEEARHGVQAELFGNFGFLGDTGKQGKRLSFVSFRPTLEAILQTVPAKRRLQARCYQLGQRGKGGTCRSRSSMCRENVVLGKQRLEDTGVCVTQTALETQLSRLHSLVNGACSLHTEVLLWCQRRES